MIQRKEYLEKLISWKNEKVIKVITGIRRCGKSTLLKLYRDYLLQNNITADCIFFINFEDLEYEHLLDYKLLYNYITEKLNKDSMNYIFLDEIQKVPEFEKVVDSLYIKDNVDLYITGSNAFLLSGELATLLSGRYIEINMLPLSFSEYCETKDTTDIDILFSEFMHTGGLPYISYFGAEDDRIDMYLEGIYNTIIVKDIEERQKRIEKDPDRRKVNDIVMLKNIAKFLAGSIGNPISVKSISDYITSSGRKVSPNTIDDYLTALIEPYIFYPVDRFDIQGKQLLKNNKKMYIVDLGLRNHILPKKNYDLGFSLKNIVFLELRRRGFSVNIGKYGNLEVDFIAKKNNRIFYFQVTAYMIDESTFKREMQPLKLITDNYDKTVLTLDRYTVGNYDGINIINVLDWLLGK